MSPLYDIAILAGYLANQGELPEIVKQAIGNLKNLALAQSALTPAKKKRKMASFTPEQRERQLANLAAMRDARLKIGMTFWTSDRVEKLYELKAEGKMHREIAEILGTTKSGVDNAVYKNKV